MLKICNYPLRNGETCQKQVWSSGFCGLHDALAREKVEKDLEARRLKAVKEKQEAEEKLINSLHEWLK